MSSPSKPSSKNRCFQREIVGAFGAGRVVPPGDVEGLKQAIRELLDDADALAEARAGALAARTALTWDSAASAHLELYRELQ